MQRILYIFILLYLGNVVKRKYGFANIRYPEARGMGVSLWWLVLRSASARSYEHIPPVRLDVSYHRPIRNTSGELSGTLQTSVLL